MRYVALLRGINVGGNNKVSMAALKAAFEEHGFSGVSSYINSGNLLFSSDETDKRGLQAVCEGMILRGFGLDISVCLLTAAELVEAIGNAPAWWNCGEGIKHNAIFVIAPATAAEVCAQVGEIRPEYEKLAVHGSVIFWSAPLKTYSRTRWSKVLGTAAYGQITIRNANTASKLAALAQQME